MDFATELDPDPEFKRSPCEVGLGWLVNLQADDFVGKKRLRLRKTLVMPQSIHITKSLQRHFY
jgi:glycine cleavage system aminomethyltransferase T